MWALQKFTEVLELFESKKERNTVYDPQMECSMTVI